MNRRSPARSRGVTLIELLIASSIGLVVIAAVGALFMTSSNALREDERRSFMNQELGYAIAQLVQDLEMAGHWARTHDPVAVELHPTNLAVAQDCGKSGVNWAFADRTALTVLDNATGAGTNVEHQCVPASAVSDGSDVIAIKRVAGRVSSTHANLAALTAGAVYLRTGNINAMLFRNDGSNFGYVPPPYENWEYRPAVYYVQSNVDGTGEPGLCRRILRATGLATAPEFQQECLAQGVEMMQVEVGVDTDADGAANYFVSSPDPAVLSQIVSVRLFLLARSSRPDFNHLEPDTKTYAFSNMPAPGHQPEGADRRYYHTTLSTEIVVRNSRSLQGVAIQ